MSMLSSAVLATANIVMRANTPIGKPGAPAATTCSSGVSPSDSSSSGTTATEMMPISRYRTIATPSARNITLGKVRTGSCVSSAVFTESSKPTRAKNASAVAAVMAVKGVWPSARSSWVARERSPRPPRSAQAPTPSTMSRPDSSTSVRTTLALTLSPTPRRLIAATRSMKSSATAVTTRAGGASTPNRFIALEENARDAVEAEVTPERITVKATMKVSTCTPKALCV